MNCPWYISTKAIQDLLRIKRLPVTTDGPAFEAAEQELMQMAERVWEGEQKGKKTAGGLTQFRGPRPRKLTLTVSYSDRPEGDLPQLVGVSAPAAARGSRA